MNMFEFSIIASGLDPKAEDFEARFYDSGCDDALVSFQKGHIIIDFARDADSFEEAVASAIENVRSTGAIVEHVEPDPLVSLSEIAARTNLSRAAITQYSKGQRGKNFPAPIAKITSDSPLWDWPTVATWMYRNGKVSRETVVEAIVVKCANEALVAGQRDIRKRLKETVPSCVVGL